MLVEKDPIIVVAQLQTDLPPTLTSLQETPNGEPEEGPRCGGGAGKLLLLGLRVPWASCSGSCTDLDS